MKQIYLILLSLTFLFCTPKGPQTFDNPFIGKTKTQLIAAKGIAKKIKVFDEAEAYIYTRKEEYYGTKSNKENLKPKKVYLIEHIYYINKKGIIYKYQIWKKKIHSSHK